MADDDNAPGGNEAGPKKGKAPDGTLRVRQVQARLARANQMENERRAEAVRRQIAMEVLTAIAKGEVRHARRFAAAAIGMELPEGPLAGKRQQGEGGGSDES